MNDPNPYGAPATRVEDRPDPVDQRFRWKAVLLGALTDLGGSAIAGIVLVVIFTIWFAPGDGEAQEMLDQLARSWPFLMVSMVVGGCFTVLGGYVAGRIARHSFLKHAVVAGALSLVLGILLFRADEGPYSGVVALLGYGLHLPLALLGGWLASQRPLGR